MTVRSRLRRRSASDRRSSRHSSTARPRVGVFGLLGSGNLGNDASLEVVLDYLRTDHPDAIIDAMCNGPDTLKARYGIDAIAMQYYWERARIAPRAKALTMKVFGKGVDAFRTMVWVRRHDVVIVPGMGVLETSLPLRATGMPFSIFLLCVSGKLFGTKVALVSVGATPIKQRATRWLFNQAARSAWYRSYRDAGSLEAMRQRGVWRPDDRVYPDLVFGMAVPDGDSGEPKTVGVGVMAYYGSTDDRSDADDIYRRQLEEMERFIEWLIDNGYRVRLFWGDGVDTPAVEEIVSNVGARRPNADRDQVVAKPCSSLRELMAEMASVGTVVAIRYHNVMSALKLSKPTIAIGYSSKHDDLMADMGMAEFTLSAKDLDADELIARFREVSERAPELRRILQARNIERKHDVDEQFAKLSSLLFGVRRDGVLDLTTPIPDDSPARGHATP